MTARVTVLAALAALYSCNSGFASDCNPLDFQKTLVYTQDIRTDLLIRSELIIDPAYN
jgi:hypothetical protein